MAVVGVTTTGAGEDSGGTGVVMGFSDTAGGDLCGSVDIASGTAGTDAGWVSGTTTAGLIRETGTQPDGHSGSEGKSAPAAGALAAGIIAGLGADVAAG